MNRPFRILYYNWVDYLDVEERGGGVTLYQRNVMNGLKDRDDVDVAFLAAGLSYDLPARAPRWEAMRHGPRTDGDQRFELINSGVLAPAHHSFGDPAQLSHRATTDTFFDFIDQTGPYDVIHFNNLEGLPAEVLQIKARWPDTQVILSLHNYYPICPQVNLWFGEREACEDFEGGARCLRCLTHQHDARLLRVANGVSYRLRCLGLQPGTWTFDVAYRWILRLGGRGLRVLRWMRSRRTNAAITPVLDPHKGADRAAAFAARRAGMTALINENCDHVLCVSDAVRLLAERHGIAPALTRTSYIGTRAADLFDQTVPRPQVVGKPTLTLGYLGYMRRDKGFFFLLDALEALPANQAGRIRIVIAARSVDRASMARLTRLGDHLAAVIYHDGYTHDDLDAVLAQVDVGVVPVLWHDNLPQVAIEMHARHIPLLTADMGGAPELGNCADLVFAAGDPDSFAACVEKLLAGKIDMDTYWRGAMRPVAMQAHIGELLRTYGAPDVSD
tara:strand:- start:157 stop:1662 length:1506 start_codon:yes stop_codon:yes gene_type:complete